jgi:hypothetical protein
MKVTMKRHIAGTVPRKLELVNVSCVLRHIGSERSIVVSQDRAAIHISFLPGSFAAELPPFWELEALIDQGLALELALTIMAARRSQARPVFAGAPEAPAAELPLALAPAHP